MGSPTPEVFVPAGRVPRWVDNFGRRHGGTTLAVHDGCLCGDAVDGSRFAARLPFATSFAGPPDAGAFAAAVEVPERWGILLVR
jgi:hypothetical protein